MASRWTEHRQRSAGRGGSRGRWGDPGLGPGAGGEPIPPSGFLFIADDDGALLTDDDGAYLLVESV